MLVPAVSMVSAGTNDCGIEIQPALKQVGFNETFSVNVVISNSAALPLNALQVFMSFDKDVLQVNSITSAGTPFTQVVSGPSFDNTTGEISFNAGTPPGTNTTATAPYLMTINMESKTTSGTTTIAFQNIPPPTIPPRQTKVYGDGLGDVLNWTEVANCTVTVGVPPAISVSPNSLAFNAIEEGENPPDRTLELCNSESGTLDWSLTDNAAWLSESPTSASLPEGECENVVVSVDVTGMEAGDYSATITITGSGEVQVPVSLHIESAMVPIPGGPVGLSASALSISPQQVQPGEEVTISINVANTGGETGNYNAVLYINEVVEDSQSVSLAAGTSKDVIFTVSKSQAGVYDVSVAGQNGQFEVVGGDWVGGGGLGTGGIIAVVVAVIALIVGLFLIRRGTRRGT
jgi:hypothetical protein